MKTTLLIHIAAVLATGLIAGLFYGYSCSVNPGLGRLGDGAYLAAFRSINRVIQNPVFFLSFAGSALLLPLATYLLRNGNTFAFYLMLAATLCYIAGVFSVTVFGNVPLNEQLDRFAVTEATAAQLKTMRDAFEKPWNLYHLVRSWAPGAAFLLSLASLVKLNK